MSTVVKVIEVISQSDKSWEDATRNAVKEASKTVKNIKTIWVENFSGTVEGNKLVNFRVNVKLSFLIEGTK